MPVPKKSANETETVVDTPVAAPMPAAVATAAVTEDGASLTPNEAESASQNGSDDSEEAPKKKRGRQPGAPTAPPFDQQMFFVMRAQARKLASQQRAAGLAVEVDPAKLLEAVKGYPGFDGVDRGRLVSKYKQGVKQVNESPKGEEINSQGLEHPLYLPPLTEGRAKINFLALEEE